MMAASFWSLLAPAIELSEAMGLPPLAPPARRIPGRRRSSCKLVDKVLPHLHIGADREQAEGPKTTLEAQRPPRPRHHPAQHPRGPGRRRRLRRRGRGHRVGEPGRRRRPRPRHRPAEFPRGGGRLRAAAARGLLAAQELLVRAALGRRGARRGRARRRSSSVLMRPILPYALAFAAGAMIYVVVEEVIPESQGSGNSDISTLGAIAGFAVMMFLDVALG